MQPCAGLLRDVGDLLERIDRARVDVAGLSADDRRPVEPRERLVGAQSGIIRPCASAAYRHDACGAEPEEAQGAVDGGVALGADEDVDHRRADQAALVDVPADSRRGRRGGRRRAR